MRNYVESLFATSFRNEERVLNKNIFGTQKALSFDKAFCSVVWIMRQE